MPKITSHVNNPTTSHCTVARITCSSRTDSNASKEYKEPNIFICFNSYNPDENFVQLLLQCPWYADVNRQSRQAKQNKTILVSQDRVGNDVHNKLIQIWLLGLVRIIKLSWFPCGESFPLVSVLHTYTFYFGVVCWFNQLGCDRDGNENNKMFQANIYFIIWRVRQEYFTLWARIVWLFWSYR